MAFLSESAVEQALLDQLHSLNYSIEREEEIGPDGHCPERESHDEVVLRKRFEEAVARLNPGLSAEARQDAIRKVAQSELPSLLEENRRLPRLMTEGVDGRVLRRGLYIDGGQGRADRLRAPGAERLAGRQPVCCDQRPEQPAA